MSKTKRNFINSGFSLRSQKKKKIWILNTFVSIFPLKFIHTVPKYLVNNWEFSLFFAMIPFWG